MKNQYIAQLWIKNANPEILQARMGILHSKTVILPMLPVSTLISWNTSTQRYTRSNTDEILHIQNGEICQTFPGVSDTLKSCE